MTEDVPTIYDAYPVKPLAPPSSFSLDQVVCAHMIAVVSILSSEKSIKQRCLLIQKRFIVKQSDLGFRDQSKLNFKNPANELVISRIAQDAFHTQTTYIYEYMKYPKAFPLSLAEEARAT